MSQFEKLMSLIELEKEKVEKEIKIAQESEAQKIIVSKVLEDCSDEADLINIDFNLFSSFDDYKKKEMKTNVRFGAVRSRCRQFLKGLPQHIRMQSPN